MGLFSSRKTAEEEPDENRSIVIAHDGVMGDWVNGSPLADLVPDSMRVSTTSAFSSIIAVYACVTLRAETVGSLPLLTYKRLSDERRERIPEQNQTTGPSGWQVRLARMLHQTPNPEMTSQEFWETVVGHIDLWGNSYSNVVRTSGRPDALWPLRPDRMRIERVNGRRVYIYTMLDGEQRKLAPSEVMHIRSMSLDGVYGVSPIGVARNALRISRAAEAHAENFYRQGGVPAGVLQRDEPFKGSPAQQQEQMKLVREGYEAMHSGFNNAHRVAILAGVKWQDVGMPLEDAQMLQTREFELAEIARMYRIPPHMIGLVDRSTSWGSGIEVQGLGFLTFTLRPILERIEQAAGRDLGFPGEEASTLLDEGIFAEFEVGGLLRADTKSRYEAYAVGLQNKFLVPNQVRALENMEPLEGGDDVIELPGQTGQVAASAQQAASLELVASILGRDVPVPNVTVNNQPPQVVRSVQGHTDDTLAASVEGLRNEIHAVELFSRIRDDLDAMHSLADATIAAQDKTRELAEEMRDSTKSTVDKLAADTRAVQTELFGEIEVLKRPRIRRVERGEDKFITRIVDEVDEMAVSTNGNGKPSP